MSLLLAALALASVAAPAAAFTVGKPDDPGNHEEITHEALAAKGYDSVSGGQVVFGNVDTDAKEWTNPAAHFDAEAFSAGSKRLKAKFDAVLDALAGCDGPQARYHLGRMLHGVQDFYSHSNWVETEGPDTMPDLFALADPAPEDACDPKSHQGPLTSGYFPDDKRPQPHKCVHGELNKDASWRPFFKEARAGALLATEDVLDSVDAAIRQRFAKSSPELRVRFLKESALDDATADVCTPEN